MVGLAHLTITLAWRVLAAIIALAGVALRWSELGMWGLSNDESWVGYVTRVEGLGQMWLAIAMTPVAWAASVKIASVTLGGSELALRFVPFAFGCLTLWAAYRAGRRFAGHELGGVLALAVVAFEPLAIGYAKILKQYTAEAFFALVAIDRAAAFAERRTRRDLVLLALVLVVGVWFANALLFLAPPIVAALWLDALGRRDRSIVLDLLVTTAVVALVDALYYQFVLQPRLPAAHDEYWQSQVYLPPQPVEAARLLWDRVGWTLRPALGPWGFPVGMLCLAIAAARRGRRITGLALALLIVELALLSMRGIVPVSQPRILIFLTTTLGAYAGAAVGALLVQASASRVLAPVGAIGLALLIHDFVRAHPWRVLGRATQVEDVGPLVREFEREAQPGDVLLLHQTAFFVWGYYQSATPVLDPVRALSLGYVPRVTDPRVVLVNDATVGELAAAALTRSPRVWFIGSRLRVPRERRIRQELERGATPVLERRRPGALLIRLEPR